MQIARRFNVIRGSKNYSSPSTQTSRRKTPSKATSTKRSPPLIALFEEAELPPRLTARLRKLDAEQLQIVEIVAAAIERGAL